MFLYLTTQGTKLSKDGGYFIFSKSENKKEISNKKEEENNINNIEKYPIGTIEGIFIFGGIQLTTMTIRECLKLNIPVFFLSTYGQLFGKLDSLNVNNVENLYIQAKYSQDEEISFYYAKIFILNKIRNSVTMIKRWIRLYYKKELSEKDIIDIEYRMKKIKVYFIKIQNLKKDKDKLRAYEGLVAELYFNIYNYFLPNSFSISGRNKRPPLDRTNALLSLGYTFLTETIQIMLEMYGFNPQLGFFHKPRSLRSLLVLDYMEMFRSWVIDDLILYLIRNNIIRENDFLINKNNKKKPVTLNKVSLNIFISNYGKKFFLKKDLKTIKMIERDLIKFKKSIKENDYASYKGFNLNII